MEINNSTQLELTQQLKNYNEKIESNLKFTDILNQNISSVEASSKLPDDAMENIKQDWIDSLTNEKFDKLLDKLDLQELSDTDKKLYKSIVEDRYITDEEVKDLSYEQIQTLEKFVFHKDEKDSYVDETIISMDSVAGHLLSTPVISDDENFNKAIFTMAKSMDDDNRSLTFFMQDITGVHGGSLSAFPDLQSIHYDGKDIAEELEMIIAKYKDKFNTSEDEGAMKYLQNMQNQFTDLLNIFNQLSGKDVDKIEESEEIVDIRQKLIDDLLSLIKTGLTVSEMEELQELIDEINKLINDSKEKDIDEDKLEEMISALEEKIMQLQKRMGIENIIKPNKEKDKSGSDELSTTMKVFKSVVDSLEIALKEIEKKSNELGFHSSTQDEMKLRQELNK